MGWMYYEKECPNCKIVFNGLSYQKFCTPQCKHNFRLNSRRHVDDPILDMQNEIWVDIESFPLYFISNMGRIKRKSYVWSKKHDGINIVQNERLIKLSSILEYKSARLWNGSKGVNVRVHRLLAMAFIPNPENKPHINHINGIKSDNSLDNLEWCTHQENMLHAYSIGLNRVSEYQKKQTSLANRGSNAKHAKLKEVDILPIREMKKNGISTRIIAQTYKVSMATIQYLLKGHTWKHVI